MKNLVLLACIAVLATTGANPVRRALGSRCTETLPFAHPDCNFFYVCAPYGIQEMRCAPGTVFDPQIYVCNHPRPGLCVAKPDEPTNKPEPEKPVTPEATEEPKPEPTEAPVTEPEHEPTPEEKTTPEEEPTTEEEPATEVDPAEEEETTTEAEPTEEEEPATEAEPTDDATEEPVPEPQDDQEDGGEDNCDEQETTEAPENNEEKNDDDEERTEVPDEDKDNDDKPEPTPPAEPETPASICGKQRDSLFFAPHPQDCQKFITCNFGTPIIMACKPNEYFHPKLLTCTNDATFCN